MPLLIVLALIVVPIVELYLIVQVSESLGVLPTLVVLVVLSILGGVLLRREGAKTWRAFREALAAGRLPAAEVADGALVLLGGSLLLTPGFATDALGLLCVLPPSRAVLRRWLTGFAGRRLAGGGLLGAGLMGAGLAGGGGGPRSRRRGSARGPGIVDGEVVEGEVVEGEIVDDPGQDGRGGERA